MIHVALRMLFGDRTKYVTLVIGLAFAALLMNQQGAIFLGLLGQATGPLQNIRQGDLWVVDPDTKWVAEFRAMADQKLSRVRSVPGVEWAEPIFNGYAVTELDSGDFKRVQLLGLSRTTLAGRPVEMVEGLIEDLWTPDGVIVEARTAAMMGGVKIGDSLRLNDRRAVVVGVCKARRGFESNGIVYTTFDRAVQFSPVGREAISYILVRCKPGADHATIASDIAAQSGMAALTKDQFRARTTHFVMTQTGIGVNFSITIALGFIVGLLLSASVFYQFTLENLRHFAVLKAMGARSRRLVGMVLVQAMIVACVGYGIGAGAAGAFAIISRRSDGPLATFFPWQLLAGSFVMTLLTITLASLLSIRRVLRVSPGTVFAS